MKMSATTLCCTQLPRIDSPEPPARPIAAIDEIFAAAALPEDHPHAFRFPDRKAAAVDANIIRSPKITDKLRMKLNRKSIKSLHKALTQVDYDDDAQAMTSTEVFHHLGARCETAPTLPVPSACTQKLATKSRRFDSASGSASGDAVCLQNISTHELAVRSPATRSFEWLGAMLQRLASFPSSSLMDFLADLAPFQANLTKQTSQKLPGLSLIDIQPLL